MTSRVGDGNRKALAFGLIGIFCLASGIRAQPPGPLNQARENDTQVLSDAVSALKAVDSGLSARLAQVAAKPNGQTDVPGVPAVPTPPQDIQTIRQAASALQSSRPDLAARLDGYADQLPR